MSKEKEYANTIDFKRNKTKHSLDQSNEEESDISVTDQMKTMIQFAKLNKTSKVDINTVKLDEFRKQRNLFQIQKEASEFKKQQIDEEEIKKQKANKNQINNGISLLSTLMNSFLKEKFIHKLIMIYKAKLSIINEASKLAALIHRKKKERVFGKLINVSKIKANQIVEINESAEYSYIKDNDKLTVFYHQTNDNFITNKDPKKERIDRDIKITTIEKQSKITKTLNETDLLLPRENKDVVNKINKNKELSNNTQSNSNVATEKYTINPINEIPLHLEKNAEKKEFLLVNDKPKMILKQKHSLTMKDNENMLRQHKEEIELINNNNLLNTITIHPNKREIIQKVEDKKNKLKLKLQQKQEYFSKLEYEMKSKSETMKDLENQIEKQKNKVDLIFEGEEVSLTPSMVSSVDNHNLITQGISKLFNLFNDTIRRRVFDVLLIAHGKKRLRKPTKKITHRLDYILSSKLRNQATDLFSMQQDNPLFDYPLLFTKRKNKKQKTKYNNEQHLIQRTTLRDSTIDQKENNNLNEEINQVNNTPAFEKQLTWKKKQNNKVTFEDLFKQTDDENIPNKTIALDLDQINEESIYENDNEEHRELLEYDKFYKEDFFKEEMFKADEKESKDREEEELKKEVARNKIKKRIKELEKIRETQNYQGLEYKDADEEIKMLKIDYAKLNAQSTDHIDLQINNTDALLYKGRLLFNYFNGEKYNSGLPKFTIENEKDVKGKEIIQFKQVGKEEKARRYFDRCPFLEQRKKIYKYCFYTKYYCNLLCDNKWFEYFSLLVILVNTIIILVSEPTDSNNLANVSDNYFLYYYTIEALLKILSYGFICEEFAYLKDYWNILDFTVIFVGWVSFILENALQGNKISGLAGLRAFRILRPLKTVKSIKGLKNLVIALLASVLKLADTSIVLFFFFLIFSIGGVQMWSGLFQRRCMSLNYGYLWNASFRSMCTFDTDCLLYNEPGNKFICVQGYINPNNGVMNFDNTLIGFVTIFVATTMEGWTNVFLYVSQTFKDKYYINRVIIFSYFHILLFVGGYYLINLFLAVTNSEFTKVETERKEAMAKKSFYLLIKSKYDLREKEKQEKKKKERELKLRNQDKNGESVRELQYRIKEEAFYIRKNINDIPVTYDTVKDIYIIQNDNPEELSKMDDLINEEEEFLRQDTKNQCSNLDKIITQQHKDKKMLQQQNAKTKSSLLESNCNEHNDKLAKYMKRKPTTILARPIEKLYRAAIELCISYTQQYMKNEMKTNKMIEVKPSQTIDALRQKIEKKEIEKHNLNQITIKEDLSYEKERKTKKDDLFRKLNEIEKKKSITILLPVQNRLVSKQVVTEIANKKNQKAINEELSFLTDLSIEEEADNNDLISSINESIETVNHNFCANKQIIMQDNIKLNIDFPYPESILPALLKLKNDTIVQSKLEVMRQKFNLNNYLIKEAIKGGQISHVGRRTSYLEFLKYSQEKDDGNIFNDLMTKDKLIEGQKELDISLYNKEDYFSMTSKSFSDADIANEEIPCNNNDVFDEGLDFEEMTSRIENNKVTSLARKSILDKNNNFRTHNFNNMNKIQSFYSNVNKQMLGNIKIDGKEPRRRNDKQATRSHLFVELNADRIEETNNKSESKKQNEPAQENELNKKKTYLYKSPSIDKNLWKYPQENTKELLVEEKNTKRKFENLSSEQEMIPFNMRSRKYYMNYLFNIKDKDVKIKDEFRVDQWKSEVLGKEKQLFTKYDLPESKEAVFVFNDKELNIKKYKYIYNKQFNYLEDEYVCLTHRLTNLPINILELMPPRITDFGKYAVGKDIQIEILNKKNSIMKGSKSTMKFSQSSITSDNTSRSKSGLTMGSTLNNGYRYLDQIKYKKNFYDKVFRKMDTFNYKTLSHYFIEEENLYFKLTDEKRREEKRKEDLRSKIRDSVLEVKSEVKAIRIFDLRTNSRRYLMWSGEDVLIKENPDDHLKEWNTMIYNLENFEVIIWTTEGSMKIIQKLRYGLYLISINQWVDYSIMLIVIANAVVMALDGNLFTPETFNAISVSNYAFNSIFIAEFLVKFFGLGPIVYFSDAFTYLDLVIIAFAILDMAVPSTSTDIMGASKKLTSQLSFLRVFRIFRVLRLTKVLRKMKSMRLIIVSIKKSLSNVAYIVLVLIMFIMIFQLLGMSILNSNPMYQSFMNAFYVTFQVLSIENWDGVLYEMFPVSPLVFLYYLIWILIGNYILFNLFISILLQSFEGDDYDEDDEDEDDIIEKHFSLPDYFAQLKKIEKENLNRIKFSRKKKQFAKGNNKRSLTASNRSNKTSLNNSNLSGSSVNNISGSSKIRDEIEDTGDEEDGNDSKLLTGVDKTLHEWTKINVLYKQNECEYSLYIFRQHNTFRIWCMKLQSFKKFDTFILIMILFSTCRLIIDTFISGYTSVYVFDMLDIYFTLVFLFEMVVKIIALGFVLDEGTYLRDNWNKIDLVIVIVSLIDFQSLVTKYLSNSQVSSSLNFLKVLRLLRTLRPLRFISHNVQLKLIITSLFDSILPICNALFIVLIVFFMFSIVGINLFYNLYHNCFIQTNSVPFTQADSDFSSNLGTHNITNGTIGIQKFCSNHYNGVLDTGPNFKFSNIFISLMTSYVLGNMEGWPDIMNSYRVFSQYYGLFFVIYLLVVSYFFLNLFTGIMFKYFNLAWSREKNIGDDKHAEKYFDILKQIEFAEPDFRAYDMPKEDTCRFKLLSIVNGKIFDNFIMIIIMSNMITMAINYQQSSKSFSMILDYINLGFTSIFIVECVLKLIALGPWSYFHFGWNKFDFFVVVSSIVDIIFTNINTINASFLKSFQIIRVLRVLRVTRVLRLVKSLKSLEKLLQTLKWSVTALFNVFILMFLIFFIFAILGCYLYDGITYTKYQSRMTILNEFYNFDNFYNAFLLVFRCASGEAWPMIMLELAYIDENEVSVNQAFLYMILMNFISSVIMLNLFLMVTLQQYNEFTNKTYNPVEQFEDFSNHFKKVWNKYSSTKDKGYRIKKILISSFFLDFKWKKLQFPEVNKIEHIKKYITDLKLRSDNQNYVYFHDVLMKIIVKQLGNKIDRLDPENERLLKEEKTIADYIKRKINKYISTNEINKKKLNNPLSTFNPLTSHLYFKISFTYIRTFINYYKDNSEHYMNEDWNFGSEDKNEDEDESNIDEIHSSRQLKNFVDSELITDKTNKQNKETCLLLNSNNDNSIHIAHKTNKSLFNSDHSNQNLLKEQ